MKKNLLLLPLAFAWTALVADEQPVSKEELASRLNGVEASDITESPLPGVYQVSVGTQVAYITADGRYLIQGEVYDLESSLNLTERSRASRRVEILAGIDPETMIVFGPENGEVKHSITIFTDVDCGYCRQFHREIDQVNALGIEVRYLFYPRTGRDTESWAKADNVWCAGDRNEALTRAKLGGIVPENSCGETPVAYHFDLGHEVGVRGTPAIFSETGDYLGGYLPPDTLAKQLDQL